MRRVLKIGGPNPPPPPPPPPKTSEITSPGLLCKFSVELWKQGGSISISMGVFFFEFSESKARLVGDTIRGTIMSALFWDFPLSSIDKARFQSIFDNILMGSFWFYQSTASQKCGDEVVMPTWRWQADNLWVYENPLASRQTSVNRLCFNARHKVHSRSVFVWQSFRGT